MPLLRDLAMSQYVVTVEDPRMDRTKAHALRDSIITAMGAGICGADGWVDVEACGKTKQDWRATFLDLPTDMPSHDTFGRVFARIDTRNRFYATFAAFRAAIQHVLHNLRDDADELTSLMTENFHLFGQTS